MPTATTTPTPRPSPHTAEARGLTVVLTRNARAKWGQFWANRPAEEPCDLAEVLEECSPAADPSPLGVRVNAGGEAWVHPEFPSVVFVMGMQFGEAVCVTVRTLKPKQPDKLLAYLPATPAPAADAGPPPAFDPLPDGPPAERLAFAKAELAVTNAKLAGIPRGHPHRTAVAARLEEVVRCIRDAKQELHRSAERQADDPACEAAELLVRADGKYQLVPVVRYLLREVKELRAELAARTPAA